MSFENSTMSDIFHSFTIDAPIAEVWTAVATSEGLAAWLMPNDFQPVPGHKFTFRMPPQENWSGVTHCEVVELDEPHRLSFTWTSDPIHDLTPTVVTFTLEAHAGQTEFTLVHSGWDKQPAALLPVRNILDEGWGRHTVERLKTYLGLA